MNIGFNYIVLVFVGVAIGALLALLAMRRKPLFSFRNIGILMILSYGVLGIILLPYSLAIDKFVVFDSQIYLSSVNQSVFLHILGLWLFLISIIILDRKKGFGTINKEAFLKLLSYPERIDDSQSVNILPLVLFILLGAIMILGTFWYTGNVPYCNFINSSAKYFTGVTAKYINVRPLYVFGQQLLAIVGFFLFYLLMKTLESKEYKKAAIFLLLFLLNSFPLVLTMKRGEIFFPIIMYVGGMILLNRIKIVQIAVIAFTLIWLASILDPANSNRPLSNIVCCMQEPIVQPTVPKKVPKGLPLEERIASLAKAIASIMKGKANFFANSFGIQVRESTRLLYNFHYKDAPYLYGRSFVAGLLGFIPTDIFPFKEKYQIGRVTLRLYGLDPECAGGPRIGIIGESYINFGFLGVFVFSFLLGMLIWFLDRYYIWLYENGNGEHKLLHMSVMFMILNHVGAGIYLDGSGALQTAVIRAAIFILITLSLFWWLKKRNNRVAT